MAAHMLIASQQSPAGEKSKLAAAFPGACGNTNPDMLRPPAGFKGGKVTTVPRHRLAGKGPDSGQQSPGSHHGIGSHRCCHCCHGNPARPDGNASVLWLHHGRLLYPLAQCGLWTGYMAAPLRRKARCDE